MPHILKSFDMDTQQGTWIFPWSDLTELPDSSEPLLCWPHSQSWIHPDRLGLALHLCLGDLDVCIT